MNKLEAVGLGKIAQAFNLGFHCPYDFEAMSNAQAVFVAREAVGILNHEAQEALLECEAIQWAQRQGIGIEEARQSVGMLADRLRQIIREEMGHES